MKPQRLFLDSDVVISALISTQGAAFKILEEKQAQLFISNLSELEIRRVSQKLDVDLLRFESWLKKRLFLVKLVEPLVAIKKRYGSYVTDPTDAHILAGNVKSLARILITYNHRHFRRDRIKTNLGIILMTPGEYLQYLRSLQ